MTYNPFYDIIKLMEEVGLYNIGLAFIFVFVLSLGLLEAAEIFKSKKINTILSVIIAFFSIYYQPTANIIFYLLSRMSIFVVGGFVAIFLVYVLSKIKVVGGDENDIKSEMNEFIKRVKIFAVAIAAAIGLYLLYTSGVAEMIGLTNLFPSLLPLLPPFVIIGGLIYFVYHIVRGPALERKKQMREREKEIQEIYRKHYKEMYEHYKKEGYPQEIADKKAKKDAEKLIDKMY